MRTNEIDYTILDNMIQICEDSNNNPSSYIMKDGLPYINKNDYE